MEKKGNYEIIPQEIEGLFKVTNLNSGDIYEVDIKKPSCSCKRFKYNKQNKKGIKKKCKHIKFCEGIKNEQHIVAVVFGDLFFTNNNSVFGEKGKCLCYPNTQPLFRLDIHRLGCSSNMECYEG